MRTILFRGKRVDNGDWVEGFYIQIMSFGNEYHCIFEAPNIDSFNDLNDYKVIPETVGQFTGLLDKNGTKIFEQDIIKNIQADVNIVHWYGAEFCYQNYHAESLPLGDLWNPYEGENSGHEVIGNIHDNKELLK